MRFFADAFFGMALMVVILLMLGWRPTPAPVASVPLFTPRVTAIYRCPDSIGARVLARSIYREADMGEAALACFYALPGSGRDTLDPPVH